MRLIKSKSFQNGIVYAMQTDDNYPVEVTDTFLPYYTKDTTNNKHNKLCDYSLGSRLERWMIGISCMSGCPVGCKFCATGQLNKWRNLTVKEMFEQINFVLQNNNIDSTQSQEFKINYTRMGEPFMNIDNIKEVINVLPYAHHYISTIGIRGSDFSWIKDNITLQISLHSLDKQRRQELIPIKGLMSIEELGMIRTKSNLKTTVNLTLVDYQDFDIDKLKRYFDPEYFFIKLSPINTNITSNSNHMGNGIIEAQNLI